MVSTDAATVGQYKIGQVMNPSTPTPPKQPSSVNHQRPPTHVAVAARPHPRRKSRPRTSCLPPPGPPPCIQTPPGPTKVTSLGQRAHPTEETAAYIPPRTTPELRQPTHGRGTGEEGEQTHPGRHTPVPATGGPGSAAPPVPPACLPTGQLGVAPPRRRPQLHARPPTYTRPPARRDPKGRHQSRRKLTEEPICAAHRRPAAEASEPGQPAHQPTAAASHHHPPWHGRGRD